MHADVAHDLDGAAGRQFVTEADWIPGFWNYLLDLDRDDLIAELVQNDLDQNATRTVVSFGQDSLICQGNGEPVDENGWRRLRKMHGAGHQVPAKRGKIGVKNHGLKTAFTVGDEVHVASAGRAIVQTLYAKGRNKPPYPGASAQPSVDPQAPRRGCRITVRYRRMDIMPSHGEATVLAATTSPEMDALFLSACGAAAEQFAGIVSPEVVPRFELVLRHWQLGEARFFFSCTRPRRLVKRMELFRRRCTVRGTLSPLPTGLLEQAVRRLLPLRGRLAQRVADFFRRERHFFVEASWPIDGYGRPTIGTGRFRYPIGYPQDSYEARTGHSTHFNAPFASDNKRYAPARNEGTNPQLRAACESLLLDVLARHVIPHWGADGLNPLVPTSEAKDHDSAVRPLLARLARQGAMPVLKWRIAAERSLKRKKRPPRTRGFRAPVRTTLKGKKRYRFVIPIVTWSSDAIHPSISIICPRLELQLDPRTHPCIVDLLTDQKAPGFGEDFVTFDQRDVLHRVTAKGNDYFGPVVDPEREFSDPAIARSYLDVIRQALDQEGFDDQEEIDLVGTLLLPDTNGRATAVQSLYASASVPTAVPGLRVPAILHPSLVAHSLFKRKKWYRPKYTMQHFLNGGTLQGAGEDVRRAFWHWLRRNERRVAQRDRPSLSGIAIWPDEDGVLRRIQELCWPRSRRIGEVLAGSIRRPHEHVSRSKLVSVGRRARASLRRCPTLMEIGNWLNGRLAKFKPSGTLGAAAVEDLRGFERDLVILFEDKAIARLLRQTPVALPAVARDDSIQQRTALVMPTYGNDRLAVPDRFVLKHPERAGVLNKLSETLSGPTVDMLLHAFAEDGRNFSVLHPRLQHFLCATASNDSARHRLAQMPIVPVHGQPRAPAALAFGGNRGDYWGAWKTRISTKGLSQDDQRRYRDAGVSSAFPDPQTSRAFFVWLSARVQGVIERHMPCVLRHILHPAGPAQWAEIFPDIPFIPVRGQRVRRLVSLQRARRSPVYLCDAGALGDAVIEKDRAVFLTINYLREVTEPVSEFFRELGVRSLREALKEPVSVRGTGDVVRGGGDVGIRLRELRGSSFQRTFRKRLAQLGVESGLVRHDWQDRLRGVQEIRLANKVDAKYRFRNRTYPVAVDAGFDPGTGTFWMRRDHQTGTGRLYETIAKELVFKSAARPIDLLALQRTLELEFSDPSFGRQAGTRTCDETIPGEGNGRNDQEEEEQETGEAQQAAEALFGHNPFKPDPSRNTPKPTPIQSSISQGLGRSRRQRVVSPPGKGKADSRPAPKLEKRHIDGLKLSHYASHCQMCLCERPPEELAPAGSYVQWEEVRRHVIEAHHPDLKSAGGARHAGNLVLLCKLHHDNYGRRLTRESITGALQTGAKRKHIRFGVKSRVDGQHVKLVIADTGEVVDLFFTDEHADYWLSHAEVGHNNGPSTGD